MSLFDGIGFSLVGRLSTWLMVFAYVILNAFGALAIKHKINQLGPVSTETFGGTIVYFVRLFMSPTVLIAFGAIFVSAIAWMIALSRLEISTAYPVAVGLNFLVVVGFSLAFFGESMSLQKMLAIALLFVSIYLLTRP